MAGYVGIQLHKVFAGIAFFEMWQRLQSKVSTQKEVLKNIVDYINEFEEWKI